MIYKVRIMYAFILSTLLLGSLIYFSFNLLGPSLLSKSTETIVINDDIYETNEKNVSIASIANNYKHLKNKSNISDMLRQQTQNNKHNRLKTKIHSKSQCNLQIQVLRSSIPS